MTMFRFSNVRKDVEDFSLTTDDCRIEQGGIYAVVGPNGCGKSTFLHLLAFLDQPTSGEVRFAGEAVDYAKAATLVGYRRRVGYLMQDPYLFNTDVRNNVECGLKLRGVSSKEAVQRADEMLSRLALTHLAHKRAHELSSGEAQRVALARTLVLDADILLLDEPTANVDSLNSGIIEKMVLECNAERGTTIVFSTHLREQAQRMSQNTISIINGRIQ